MSTKTEQQIEWRRGKVLEMRARGLSYQDIAHELQVSKALIGTDLLYLRSQAKDSIKQYVTEHMPEQFQICLTALDEIIKRTFAIIESSDDNREKMQAMELFKDTHLVKLELLSNATTIDSALNYIRGKQSQQEKRLSPAGTKLNDSNENEDEKLVPDGTNFEDADDERLSAAAGKQSVF